MVADLRAAQGNDVPGRKGVVLADNCSVDEHGIESTEAPQQVLAILGRSLCV
jgi:hypothetical protein